MVGAVLFLVAMLVGDMFNGLAAVGLLAVGMIGRALFRHGAAAGEQV
jgi:hypothetical protein